ncbi:MAG TPA: epoxyqueuosine reductase QueH [Kiritimatiellia bacterium]|nr:epoxyqueuosine reductase QueH [Kiritimatiellia bacterium]HRU69826.1 epoxyqueuosine reductase QueH [Kiritimatiellia bacterium]
MRVLLHTCCAPCASHCVLALQELGHDVTLFYSNANIAPHDEFLRRLDAVRLLADRVRVPLLVDEPDHDAWLREAACGFEREPERGARCARCFRYSLCRTREAMTAHGLDAFTTSLTVSPHKHTPTLFQVGRDLDAARFLTIDFKKRDGFKHSLHLAEAFGLYRQKYCGCEFSYRTESSVPKL